MEIHHILQRPVWRGWSRKVIRDSGQPQAQRWLPKIPVWGKLSNFSEPRFTIARILPLCAASLHFTFPLVLFTWVRWFIFQDGMRGNGLMLCQGRFRFVVRKDFFSGGVVLHWHSCPGSCSHCPWGCSSNVEMTWGHCYWQYWWLVGSWPNDLRGLLEPQWFYETKKQRSREWSFCFPCRCWTCCCAPVLPWPNCFFPFMHKQMPVPSRAVKQSSFQTTKLTCKIISLIIPLAAQILPELCSPPLPTCTSCSPLGRSAVCVSPPQGVRARTSSSCLCPSDAWPEWCLSVSLFSIAGLSAQL